MQAFDIPKSQTISRAVQMGDGFKYKPLIQAFRPVHNSCLRERTISRLRTFPIFNWQEISKQK